MVGPLSPSERSSARDRACARAGLDEALELARIACSLSTLRLPCLASTTSGLRAATWRRPTEDGAVPMLRCVLNRIHIVPHSRRKSLMQHANCILLTDY